MDVAGVAGHLHAVMGQSPWLLYACLMVGPFVQEDAAVLGAAAAVAGGMSAIAPAYLAVTVGLCASDLWKYWLGRAARTHAWAQRFAKGEAIQKAQAQLDARMGATIAAFRFVPGTRIALYTAAGYLGASWSRFAFWVVVTAAGFVAFVFAGVITLGMIAGPAVQRYALIAAVAAVAVVISGRIIAQRLSKQG